MAQADNIRLLMVLKVKNLIPGLPIKEELRITVNDA